MRRRPGPGSFLLLALVGCTPDYGAGGFQCLSGQCPEGYVCIVESTSRTCRLPGTSGDRGTSDRPGLRVDLRRLDQVRGEERRDSGPGGDTCLPQTYFKDSDGDGAGNPLVKAIACAPPAGYVAKGLDCDDGDADARPGQTAFFEQPSKGTKSFDFNCDKVEEKEHGSLVSCSPSGAGCTGDGWSGGVPSCGQSGSYAKCFKQSGMSACSQSLSTLVQRCR